MKPMTIFLVVVAVLGLQSAYSQWSEQVSGTRQSISSIDFVDGYHGWAVFADSVIRTTDGGATWNRNKIGFNASLVSVQFLDQFTGWACGASSNSSFIGRTIDGGSSWEDVSPGTGTWMNGVFFVNPQNGWAFGQTGYPGIAVIVHTTNGGNSWTPQDVGTVDHQLSGFFVDVSTGWAVGATVLLATTNGGGSWSEQDTAYTHSASAVPLRSVHFANRDIGWVVGGIANNVVIAKTTDGGQTWVHKFFEPPASVLDVGRLEWVDFVDATKGWAVGKTVDYSKGAIIHTTDAGDTWLQQPLGNAQPLHSIKFVDENMGWAVGEGGTILATVNGGISAVAPQIQLPAEVILRQNYPNPFNPKTTLEFDLVENAAISLVIYDILGREVVTLARGIYPGGHHSLIWDAGSEASGVYYARFTAADESGKVRYSKVNRLLLMK